jgi:glycosyltransferase involved in cell wall biosynthesis
MDVFAMSSVDEGLPMAMIEAMASSTPVVVTAVGAIPKVIKDSINGMLVESRDSASLAAKIIRLLDNPQLRYELSCRAFDDAKVKYSKEAMCRRYTDVYNELLGYE